jgi:hypothetical protein
MNKSMRDRGTTILPFGELYLRVEEEKHNQKTITVHTSLADAMDNSTDLPRMKIIDVGGFGKDIEALRTLFLE